MGRYNGRLSRLRRQIKRDDRDPDDRAIDEMLVYFNDAELDALFTMADGLHVGWNTVSADVIALVKVGMERAAGLVQLQGAKELTANWIALLEGFQ